MEYLDSCGQKVEAFIRSSDQFQNSCNAAFETVDVRGQGKVSVAAAATACVFFFKVGGSLCHSSTTTTAASPTAAAANSQQPGCPASSVAALGFACIRTEFVHCPAVHLAQDVGRAVDDFGIRIKEPSADEIKKIMTVSMQAAVLAAKQASA